MAVISSERTAVGVSHGGGKAEAEGKRLKVRVALPLG